MRAALRAERRREGNQDEGHDVEQIAVVQPSLAEAKVVRGHLDEKHRERHDGDRCEGVLLPRPGLDEVREEPGDSQHERQDPKAEAEWREVLQ